MLFYLHVWTKLLRKSQLPNYCEGRLCLLAPFLQLDGHFRSKADGEMYFAENNYSLWVTLIAFLPVFVGFFFSLCSRLRPCALRLRKPGGRRALFLWGCRDPPAEPRHSDGRRLLGGRAERTGGGFPLRAGGGSHWEWGDERRRAQWHTGTDTPAHTRRRLTDKRRWAVCVPLEESEGKT